jgi:hypothetical protein
MFRKLLRGTSSTHDSAGIWAGHLPETLPT